MKLLDIIKEEARPITEKERIRARKVYKGLKTGIYRPYSDTNLIKYVLPDFEDHQTYKLSNEDMVMMFTDLKLIKVYIITNDGNEVDARRIGPDDSAVIRNVKEKIKSRFLKYGIVMNIANL